MIVSKILESLLKLTKESKTPTDLELDEKIEKLNFELPYFYSLLKEIIREKLKRFFKYKYKSFIKDILIISSFCIGTYYVVVKGIEPILNETLIIEKSYYRTDLKSYDEFIKVVLHKESTGNYKATSPNSSALGGFQFMPSTLKELGVDVEKIGRDNFLENEELQKGVFKQSLIKSKRDAKKYIERYDGREIKGVKGTITESGILMSFHLKPVEARNFFESGGVNTGTGDANGTTVKDYIELFSGYHIPF